MEFGECVAVIVGQTEIYYVLKVFKGWYLVDYHLAQHRHDVSRVETVGDGNTVNHDFLFPNQLYGGIAQESLQRRACMCHGHSPRTCEHENGKR